MTTSPSLREEIESAKQYRLYLIKCGDYDDKIDMLKTLIAAAEEAEALRERQAEILSELTGVVLENEALRERVKQLEKMRDINGFITVHKTTDETLKENTRLKAEVMGGWKPISEAPRDGTRILVFNDANGGYHTEPFDIGVAEWSTCLGEYQWGSIACCDGVSYYTPTHWMHLPPKPEGAA